MKGESRLQVICRWDGWEFEVVYTWQPHFQSRQSENVRKEWLYRFYRFKGPNANSYTLCNPLSLIKLLSPVFFFFFKDQFKNTYYFIYIVICLYCYEEPLEGEYTNVSITLVDDREGFLTFFNFKAKLNFLKNRVITVIKR